MAEDHSSDQQQQDDDGSSGGGGGSNDESSSNSSSIEASGLASPPLADGDDADESIEAGESQELIDAARAGNRAGNQSESSESSNSSSSDDENADAANQNQKDELPPVMLDLSLNLEECRAITRMATRESDRLAKVRKGLVEDGLVSSVREVDQHIRIIGGIKAMVAIQVEAFAPTPIEREIEARTLSSAQREALSAPMVNDDEITMPDGSRLPIDMLVKNGANEGEFIVKSHGGEITIWHDKPSGQWRVVKLALEYPDTAASASVSPVRSPVRSIDSAKRGGKPQPLAAVAKKVVSSAKKSGAGSSAGKSSSSNGRGRKAVANATGERKVRPAPKPVPKKRGRR